MHIIPLFLTLAFKKT